ncbi:MAG: peptidylprolyl isomerase [Candidatus Woesearchaeota archaeon]
MGIRKGDHVVVSYVGTLDDGTVFDASEKHDHPLHFVVGSGQLIQGFDDAVLGMEKGEEKKIILEPEQAYGPKHEHLVQTIPREYFPPDQPIAVDMLFLVGLPGGNEFPAKVVAFTDTSVTLDLNHPLAGKRLTFAIKILDVHSSADH